ncbi:SMP-30/gluconolactonase/LRE family protein [Candidatus Kaiserbacteria bacterium]|nr:MAG: SMP-30/gluconolactonase/LRE family protein [Candidatus Kaiserbacteria bacterium]
MKTYIAELVYMSSAVLGEGPLWDEKRGVLWWVDIVGGQVHKFNPGTKQDEIFSIGTPVGAVVLDKEGHLILAVKNGFARYDTETNTLEMLATVEHTNKSIRFNDGKCDPYGRLWAGTLAEDGTPDAGRLFCLEHDFSVTEKQSGVGISNGIGWNANEDTMYYIDSQSQQVVAYEYDKDSGAITHPRTIVTIDEAEGTPDGMCVDSEGMVWVALWGGGKVVRINPDNGERLAEVQVPDVTHVTSCTFGGKDMNILFITTARQGLTPEEEKNEPYAGSIFAVETDTTGRFAHTYKGGK